MILSWVFALLVLANSWVSDDAFISFRTVDNFVNGYGLRYNVVERVQTYTNPLLVILMIPIHYLFHGFGLNSMYFESLGLSYCFLLIFLLLIKKLVEKNRSRSLALLLLCLNVPVIDYFTSGLENSLNYILVLFIVLLLKYERYTLMSFFSGLLVLSRYDLFVLVIPLIVYIIIAKKAELKIVQYILLFVLPWISWVAFSLIYYGSLLPNSVIAKSAFDPSFYGIIRNCFYYIKGTLDWYPLVLIIPLILFGRLLNSKKEYLALLLGASFYFLLPFFAGGDFMAGRFQTIISVLLVLLYGIQIENVESQVVKFIPFITLIFFIHPNSLVTQAKYSMFGGKDHWVLENVANEKMYYFRGTGLPVLLHESKSINNYYRCRFGNEIRATDRDTILQWLVAGYQSYYGGPKMYLTDRIGITDPLLARLPSVDPDYWRPGHPEKSYPSGYLKTLQSKENLIEDINIHALYDDILLATRSEELFTKERWAAIWRLNTGQHKIERGYE